LLATPDTKTNQDYSQIGYTHSLEQAGKNGETI
jgi:hypothetical protein